MQEFVVDNRRPGKLAIGSVRALLQLSNEAFDGDISALSV